MSASQTKRNNAAEVRRVSGRERYGYLVGRIRVIELQLLDTIRLGRLYDAKNNEDIFRVLRESGYPQSPDFETSLSLELQAVYGMLLAQMPEPGFVETLLIFHDFHNVKVILKHLFGGSLRIAAKKEQITEPGIEPDAHRNPSLAQKAAQDAREEEDQEEIHWPVEPFQPGVIDHLLRRPTGTDPEFMLRSISEHKPGLIPNWLYEAAMHAARRYMKTYDFAEMDLLLDKTAWAEVMQRANRLNCPFFSRYLRCRIDLVNLDLLLRNRLFHRGAETLERSLLPGGDMDTGSVLSLYDAQDDKIAAAYGRTPYAEIAQLAGSYGSKGSAARFSLLADNVLMDLIRQAVRVVSGPEIPLAYLFAREMEIKNIRIILTCHRNGLPQAQTRDMTRKNYLAWR